MNLFVDTSNKYILLSLFDEEVHDYKIIEANRNQAEIFVPSLNTFLHENNQSIETIDHFYFTKGPGSFTGVRVGLTYAKALKVSGYNNIHTINTLYTLLDSIENAQSIIDARGQKYYYQSVIDGVFQQPQLIAYDQVDLDKVNTYENTLQQIPSNLVELVNNHLYDDDLDILYIKEAF